MAEFDGGKPPLGSPARKLSDPMMPRSGAGIPRTSSKTILPFLAEAEKEAGGGDGNNDINEKKTVLVTGGAGFIGSHVADILLGRGDRVIIVDEMNDYYDVRLKQSNLEYLYNKYEALDTLAIYRGDICDVDFIGDVFERERPTHICHLAARAGVRASIIDPYIYVHSNIEGTTRLLDLARQYGCANFVYARSVCCAMSCAYSYPLPHTNHPTLPPPRPAMINRLLVESTLSPCCAWLLTARLHLLTPPLSPTPLPPTHPPSHPPPPTPHSSSSVYGSSSKELLSEADPIACPVSPYAATKASCELLAYTFHHLYGLNCTGLRFFTVYGPRGRCVRVTAELNGHP